MLVTQEPLISIVIPAFNAEQTICLQLASLEHQCEAPAFEVLVVDNGSKDRTAELAHEFSMNSSYPIRVITANEFQGPGYARNVGARHARADFLMFLDADDVTGAWYVKSGLRAFDDSELWSGAAIPLDSAMFSTSLEEIRKAINDRDDLQPIVFGDLLQSFPVVMGGTFGVTRSAFEKIGGFDVSLGGVSEDNDFGVRAHLSGIRADYSMSALIAYRIRSSTLARMKLSMSSARFKYLISHRYNLPLPKSQRRPISEVARAAGALLLMLAGKKEADPNGALIRIFTNLGFIQGAVRCKIQRQIPEERVGCGYWPLGSEA